MLKPIGDAVLRSVIPPPLARPLEALTLPTVAKTLQASPASLDDLGQVIKREVLEGEKAEVAAKKVAKASGRALRAAPEGEG